MVVLFLLSVLALFALDCDGTVYLLNTECDLCILRHGGFWNIGN